MIVIISGYLSFLAMHNIIQNVICNITQQHSKWKNWHKFKLPHDIYSINYLELIAFRNFQTQNTKQFQHEILKQNTCACKKDP